MCVSRLSGVGAVMKVLNLAQTVIITDEHSSNSTLHMEGECKKNNNTQLLFAFYKRLPCIARGVKKIKWIQ